MQKAEQIKAYENTKENRKKYSSKILGKNYREKSVLVLNEKELLTGETSTLLLENTIKGAEYQWSSQDETIASVTQDGVITAVSAGKTNIICKVTKGGKSYTLKCKLYVMDS
jgi:hypothetical protein